MANPTWVEVARGIAGTKPAPAENEDSVIPRSSSYSEAGAGLCSSPGGKETIVYDWESTGATEPLSPYLSALVHDVGLGNTLPGEALLEIQKFKEYGLNFSLAGEDGGTVFHDVAQYEYDQKRFPFFDAIFEEATIEALNREDSMGDTPLKRAIYFNRMDMAVKLVSVGAIMDNDLVRAFCPSSRMFKVFELLKTYNPERVMAVWFSFRLYEICNRSPRPVKDSESEKTLLRTVEFCLKKGAEPNWRERLTSSITQCGQFDDAFSLEIVRIFWRGEYVLTYPDSLDCTLLDVAIQEGSLTMCKLLLRIGVPLKTARHPCTWPKAKKFPEFLELPEVTKFLEENPQYII